MTATLDPALLIDGNNLLCRSAFAFQSLQSSDGRFLGGLYGFVKTLLRVAGFYQGTYRPIVCWDKGRSGRRMALAPDYKDRPRMDVFAEPIPQQIEWADQLCEAMGVVSIQLSNVEADDIIAVVSRLSRRSVIYSSDKDFFQLVREGHSLRRPSTKGEVVFDSATLEHFTGLKARLYLALMGDKVDNIPGVPGVGETTAKNILNALEVHPTLDYNAALQPGREPVEILELVKEALVEKRKGIRYWKNVTQHWDSFLTSLAMVDLWRDDLLTEDQLLAVMEALSKERTPDWARVQDMFRDWEFSFTVDECKSMLLGESVDLDGLWDETEDSIDDLLEDSVDEEESIDDLLEESIDESESEENLEIDEGGSEVPSTTETPKARMFSFGLGYVEDASLSKMFVRHEVGFSTVEEALESFGQVLLSLLEEEDRRHKKNFVEFCPHCKKPLSTTKAPEVDQLIDLFRDIYHGTNDSVGLFWDAFESAGWWLTPVVDYKSLSDLVSIPENAELLIGAATFPDNPPDSWFSWNDVVAPPGVRIRK